MKTSVDEYYRAKTEMLCDRMAIKCDETAITKTKNFLDNLCLERVTGCLQNYLKAPVGTPAPVAIYEILTHYEVIIQKPVISLVPDLIRIHGNSIVDLCRREKRPMPSLVILMTIPQEQVQKFALSVFNTTDHPFSVTEFAPAYRLVKKVITTICLLIYIYFVLICIYPLLLITCCFEFSFFK